jgi:hypothetical protein
MLSRRQQKALMKTERSPELSVPLKVRLAGEQNWRCCCCGAEMGLKHHIRDGQSSTVRLATFEHLRPRCKSGGDGEDNLAISCQPCNETHMAIRKWALWIIEQESTGISDKQPN